MEGSADFKEKWFDQIVQCKYLPELELKNLCELVLTLTFLLI
jgi:hypothetical protein